MPPSSGRRHSLDPLRADRRRLHSVEEWVDVRSMLTCRDALVELTRDWCR